MQEGGTTSTFNKTVYFQSNQRNLDPSTVIVSRETNISYAFSLNIQLNLGEVITFYAIWSAKAEAAGTYNINVLAFSDDPDVDPEFRTCQGNCGVQIVEDVPVINEPLISPTYHQSDLDPQEMYVYPRQNIEVRCNVTSPLGVKNVTLHFSADSDAIWNEVNMTRNLENEWAGTIPGQTEGKLIVLYVEAFSSMEKNSKTREYTCTVSDLRALELRAKIVTWATVTVIIAGCIIILALKRRRMTEIL